MSEKFKKLKGKYLISALLKSVICGLSSGLLAVGVVLLALKLSGVSLGALYYVLIGVAAALVGGGVAFIFLMPTDKKVARQLDNSYKLNERTQTSLEFSGQSGAILELQREDAEEKLVALGSVGGAIVFAKIWQVLIILAVAIVMAVTAILVPARTVAADGGYTDEENQPALITDWHITAVEVLIEEVNASNLEDGIKQPVVVELEDLVEVLADGLENGISVGQLRTAVLGAADGVEGIIGAANSYAAISGSLLASEEYNLASAIAAGATCYKTFTLTEYLHVKSFYSGSADTVTNAMNTYANEFKINLAEGEDLRTKISTTASAIISALSSSRVNSSDVLYGLLSEFARELMQIRDPAQADMSGKVDTFIDNITDALVVQSYNGAMSTYVSNRLKIIFGLPYDGPQQGSQSGGTDPGDPSDSESGKDSTGGGKGDGNVLYGSDDEVYDPRDGQYKQYSEILTWYRQIVNTEGLTEEQKNAIENFFRILFGNDVNDNADAGSAQ